MPQTIRVDVRNHVARVTLDRPDVRNAFDGTMLADLREAFTALAVDEAVRVVVLTGEGNVFCAGADLKWMRSVLDGSFEDNLEESRNLADTLRTMADLPQPLIGRINGPAMGGGVGLACVTDVSIASTDAFFALSEVRIGLTPATISPYVIRRLGVRAATPMFLTGGRVDSAEARNLGLADRLAPHNELDESVDRLVGEIVRNAPGAVVAAKELLRRVPAMSLDEARDWTAERIARRRQSEEGQEGMAAFLDKRKPAWQEGLE